LGINKKKQKEAKGKEPLIANRIPSDIQKYNN
jgi:hypothetical protein